MIQIPQYTQATASLSESGVFTFALNRPRVQNSFSDLLCTEAVDAFNFASRTPEVRVFHLTGTGQFFSGGYDIKDFQSFQAANRSDEQYMTSLGAARFFLTLLKFSKPLVASVNGPAIGMAVTLLAFCDYALAHERAFFQTPFVHLSLVPEGCSTLLFPRMIGMRKSTELLLLGRQFSCEDARNCNLVNEVVATDEQLHERAFEICEEFAEIDPLAFERSKKLLQMVDGDEVEKTFLRELRVFGQQLQTAECRQKFEQFFSRKSKL